MQSPETSFMWKTSIAALLLGTSLLAHAQQPPAQQVVQWQLQVMRDGRQIDSFEANTTVGQARTDTHHSTVQHNVGCKDQPAGSIDLGRTLTVSPLQADASHVTLSIEAQETFEDDAQQQTDTGCKLPPQPRQVSASHPGLMVPAGQWASWTIVDKNPNLVYRVRANLTPAPAGGPGSGPRSSGASAPVSGSAAGPAG
jgi:hypothetical protein